MDQKKVTSNIILNVVIVDRVFLFPEWEAYGTGTSCLTVFELISSVSSQTLQSNCNGKIFIKVMSLMPL